MKKIIIILVFAICSCSSYEPIKVYLKEEIAKDKQKGNVCILSDNIVSSRFLPDTYNEKKLKARVHYAKTFNQADYDFLKESSKTDTIVNHWTKKEQKELGFDDMIIGNYIDKGDEFQKKYHNNAIFYRISKPFYLKNSKTIIFGLGKARGYRHRIESPSIIIMKKEKSKWVFVEQVFSQAED